METSNIKEEKSSCPTTGNYRRAELLVVARDEFLDELGNMVLLQRELDEIMPDATISVG